ncbi:methyltransferase [Streptomyces sp. NPDC004111]|uniref:methyltransferase n=1 Tax=Streptomyces sp. NPDC004111 TaxID=3364690 RepID=UPI00369FD6FE
MVSTIHWTQDDRITRSARWHSENGSPLPRRVVVADDRTKAADAHRLACEGTGLLWRGDFHNARQLLTAMGRRVDRTAPGAAPKPGTRASAGAAAEASGLAPGEAYRLHRRASGHRALVLGKLLVLLEEDYTLALRRAPDVRRACREAYGRQEGPVVVSLRELLGVIGAHQWRARGVEVPALGDRVHPHYGVFAPVRGEYVGLVADAPLPRAAVQGGPAGGTAFDLGTGTGVLAAVLARRGVRRVVATDSSVRALACAQDNVRRLALDGCVEVTGPCLFPEGRADLVVCNPPWLPGRPAGAVEQGVYDPGGAMLHGFLAGLTAHLRPGGEGWLVLSDLAELLGLRTRGQLLTAIAESGLRVVERTGTVPRHPRAADATDPFHAARGAETTSLWRLVPEA